MARTTITQITDDIDGSNNAEEVSFSFMGVDYTIDLAKKNLTGLERALKPYVEAGTRVTPPSRSRSQKKTPARRSAATGDLKAVRAWAVENGYEVSARGRIPRTILEAYTNANV